MSLLALLPPTEAYEPAPWYVRWLETMPAGLAIGLLFVALVAWLLKKPVEGLVAKLFDQFTERIKRSSKEPASAMELARKARKAIILEQKTEALRIEMECDHVSVYGCQNGVYLRSGEGIDKFVMLAEAGRPGDPRYMDTERIVFAQDIPRTLLALESAPYLLLWSEHSDDWKVNKIMRERDYTSSLALLIFRPIKHPNGEMKPGVIGLVVMSWRTHLLYRPDQARSLPRDPPPPGKPHPARLITADTEALMKSYAADYGYSM